MHKTSFLAKLRLALMSASVVLLFLAPGAALAVDTGLNATNNVAQLPTTSIDTRISTIIQVVIGFVGVIFLVLMIYAGILWMTAAGNDKQIETARGIMVSAVIGLAIVFSAYAITNLAFSTVTGTTDTTSANQNADCVAGGGTVMNDGGCLQLKTTN